MTKLKTEYNKLIQQPEYNFLNESKEIKDMLFLTVGGSHAYGTNHENSDFDLRGVCFTPMKCLLGTNNFEQLVDTTTDTTIYSLDKFVKLLTNCNPNVIELLGNNNHLEDPSVDGKDSLYFQCSDAGKQLIENAHLFLSQKAYNSFSGYAYAQLRRLENNLARHNVDQKRKEEHIMDSINNMMNNLNERYIELGEENYFNLYISDSEKEDMDSEIYLSGNFKGYPLRDFKSIWSEMNNIIKEYGKVNHRNNKKDDIHLNKHMLHLVRLHLTAIDIFEKEKIITCREKDLDLLMKIRNGYFLNEDETLNSSFSDLLNELDIKMKNAKNNTSLPKEPDYKKIDKLLIELNYRRIVEYSHKFQDKRLEEILNVK